MWQGTPDSVIDLHPVRFTNSIANKFFQGSQVGIGWSTGGADDALLGHGTAESVVDLHLAKLVPEPFTSGLAFSGGLAAMKVYRRASQRETVRRY